MYVMRHEETLDSHSLENREYDQMSEVCKTEFSASEILAFGLGNCLLHRALLCLAVSLTSTH